jgi:hypothetical protein
VIGATVMWRHCTRQVKSQHVSFPEGNVRVELSSLFYHSLRNIQTENGCTRIAQVAGNMTGTTAHVAYFSTLPDFSGETIEQFPVKGLVLKLMEKVASILVRESIVIFADRLGSAVDHTVLPGSAGSVPAYCVIMIYFMGRVTHLKCNGLLRNNRAG